MKITVLLENTTKDKRLKTKHGLSLYISTQKHTLLFDLGPGKQFLKNAETLGIDVSEADAAMISHGHDDHGGGLKAFLSANSKATVYVRQSAFLPHYERGMKFDLMDFFQRHVLVHRDGVRDDRVFKTLHAGNHGRLDVDGIIAVNDGQAAFPCQGNRQF